MWALVMAAVAFITPWLTFYAFSFPDESNDPWWVLWVILLVWILAGTFGVALVIAGGRVRRIGTALIVGDAVGVVLFFITVFSAYLLLGEGT